jgi:uncharacterized damage-inducible protein DinB
MEAKEILLDGFGRARGIFRDEIEGLSREELEYVPGPGANHIAWLAWHLTRVQDDHVAELAGTPQAWAGRWAAQFGLALPPGDTGYGHTADQVALVRADAAELLSYHEDVQARTEAFVAALAPADLERVVDERWDPPVTMAVRLVSVISDDLQHLGQIGYLKGLAARANGR